MQGRPVQALEVYREASEHTTGASEPSLMLVTVAPAYVAIGDLIEAIAHYDKALQIMGDDVPLLAWTAEVSLALGDVTRARDLISHAVELGSGVPHWELSALRALSYLHLDTGEAALALSVATRLRDQALRASAGAHYQLRAHDVIGAVHRHFGRHDLAIAELSRGVTLAVARNVAYHEALLRTGLARAMLAAGDRVEAARHAYLALELAEDRGFQVTRARALTTLSSSSSASAVGLRGT